MEYFQFRFSGSFNVGSERLGLDKDWIRLDKDPGSTSLGLMDRAKGGF